MPSEDQQVPAQDGDCHDRYPINPDADDLPAGPAYIDDEARKHMFRHTVPAA